MPAIRTTDALLLVLNPGALISSTPLYLQYQAVGRTEGRKKGCESMTSLGTTGLEKVNFHSNPKERQ